MKQYGFILPSAGTLYIALGAALIIVGLGVALKVQTSRLEAKTAEHKLFVGKTKAAGEAQEKKTKETESKHNKIVKEKNDENAIAHAKLDDMARRLRNKHSSSSLVPPAANATRRADLACFDRTELNASLREFTGGIDEIIITCESRTLDLNTAKSWAQSIIKE